MTRKLRLAGGNEQGRTTYFELWVNHPIVLFQSFRFEILDDSQQIGNVTEEKRYIGRDETLGIECLHSESLGKPMEVRMK